jgi:sortase B
MTPAPTMTPTPTPVPLELPVDFDALKEINEEIYAWITVPGTDVDYPVLQSSTDDGFYLDHDVNKESAFAGAIYSEQKNAKDFSDPNTVLYGHNMKNGSMFASLHRFEDREFFDENREILVYTPDHIYHYEIFAAYTYDNRHLLNSFDFEDPDVFRDYLEEIYSIRAMNAFFLDDPIVTNEDKILTLSTCNGNSEARYLVQGVLVEVEG